MVEILLLHIEKLGWGNINRNDFHYVLESKVEDLKVTQNY